MANRLSIYKMYIKLIVTYTPQQPLVSYHNWTKIETVQKQNVAICAMTGAYSLTSNKVLNKEGNGHQSPNVQQSAIPCRVSVSTFAHLQQLLYSQSNH